MGGVHFDILHTFCGNAFFRQCSLGVPCAASSCGDEYDRYHPYICVIDHGGYRVNKRAPGNSEKSALSAPVLARNERHPRKHTFHFFRMRR